jgi:uncharacterized Zn-binding protein involved in type VI secretion
MKILGWIRQGDKTACGGVVTEGIPVHLRDGLPISFQGAYISCKRKNCVIAEGIPTTRLENGKAMCHHGHVSSAGCPVYSTMNDVDGWTNSGGEDVPVAFVPDGEGGWKGFEPPPQEHEQAYDEYFILMDEKSGAPARNRFYRVTFESGETIEGHTDDEGRTQYAASDKRRRLTLEVAPASEMQSD